MIRFRRLPMHLTFARGYQAGLVVALIVTIMVYLSVETGLDRVADRESHARAANVLVVEVHETAVLLGRIDTAPTSLSLRSDLVGQAEQLEAAWTAVVDGDLPGAVETQLFGRQGVDREIATLLEGISDLGSAGFGGLGALDPAIERPEARRLEGRAVDIAEQLVVVVGIYEAEADESIGVMQRNNLFTVSISMVFLVALVMLLLRPLRRRMERESNALIEASEVHRNEAERQELASHLADGLEAAETESETHRVVERTFARLVPDQPVELLLAEGAKGELTTPVVHPEHGGPGCGVESPWACPAVRRGRTMTYEDSTAINACPHLTAREGDPCSAVCVPLSFMGESMGVMHTTGPVDAPPETSVVDVLGLVASQVAVRIGTLRSFAQVELQASTDNLTGLPNRRATEERLRRSLADHDVVSVVVADLDNFKQLNDRFGHEAGDRALRIFADAVRTALRDEDLVGRWGGEEFVLVLPGQRAAQAEDTLNRVRSQLADACARAEAPTMTVSMGVVDSTETGTPDDLLRLADEAVLAAKAQGRNRVVVGPVVGDLLDQAMAVEAESSGDGAGS
ncbi:MAG: sensor domain-containing diguanylate cyclase [Actinomycetota bacterium]